MVGKFIGVVFLQFDLKTIDTIYNQTSINNVKKIFSQAINTAMPENKNTRHTMVIKVLPVLGKHDLLIIISSNNILKLSTSIYVGTKELKNHFRVTDMSRIIGISHNKFTKKPGKSVLGIVLFRLNMTGSNLPMDILNTLDEVTDIMKNTAQEPHFKLESDIFTTYSCHEIASIIYGNSYEKLWQYVYEIKRKCPILKTFTIPILDAHSNTLKNINEKLSAIILFDRAGKHDTKIINACSKKLNQITACKNVKIAHRFGGFDYRIGPLEISPYDLKNVISLLIERKSIDLGITNTACIISMPNVTPHKHFKKDSGKGSDIVLTNKFGKYKSREFDFLRNKLWAEAVQLEMAYSNPYYTFLLPPYPKNIVDNIESISLSEQAGGEALRMLRLCRQQRVSGTQTGESTGLISGALESLGGYQRLILAAESIPQDIMNKRRWTDNMFFTSNWKGAIVFEGTGEFSALFPKTQLLCVPISKYNPSYWPTLLGHEVGHFFIASNDTKITISLMKKAYKINQGLLKNDNKPIEPYKYIGTSHFSDVQYFIKEHLCDYFSSHIFKDRFLKSFIGYIGRRINSRNLSGPLIKKEFSMTLTRVGSFDGYYTWGRRHLLKYFSLMGRQQKEVNKLDRDRYEWITLLFNYLREEPEWADFVDYLNDHFVDDNSYDKINASTRALYSGSKTDIEDAFNINADMIDFSRAFLDIEQLGDLNPDIINTYIKVGYARRLNKVIKTLG